MPFPSDAILSAGKGSSEWTVPAAKNRAKTG